MSQGDVFSSIAIANVADANSSRRLAQQRPIFVAIHSRLAFILENVKNRAAACASHMHVLRGMDKVDVASRCRPYRDREKKIYFTERSRDEAENVDISIFTKQIIHD